MPTKPMNSDAVIELVDNARDAMQVIADTADSRIKVGWVDDLNYWMVRVETAQGDVASRAEDFNMQIEALESERDAIAGIADQLESCGSELSDQADFIAEYSDLASGEKADARDEIAGAMENLAGEFETLSTDLGVTPFGDEPGPS